MGAKPSKIDAKTALGAESKIIIVGGYKYIEDPKYFLGAGGFGAVYKGLRTRDKLHVALKKVPVGKYEQQEVDLMKSISHPNCIQLFDVVTRNMDIYIITDLCTTNLENFLKKCGGTLNSFNMPSAAKQLASGYEALFLKKIIHRDIKPQNILVVELGQEFRLKIGDFGCGRFMEQVYAKTVAGTVRYMAPELGAKIILQFGSAKYDARVDIWGLGLVLYECAVGSFPFQVDSLLTMFSAVALNQDISVYEVTVPSTLEPGLQTLLKDMLQIKYHGRITPENFFKHKFISGNQVRDSIDIRKQQLERQHEHDIIHRRSGGVNSTEQKIDNMEIIKRRELKFALTMLVDSINTSSMAEDNRTTFIREGLQKYINKLEC